LQATLFVPIKLPQLEGGIMTPSTLARWIALISLVLPVSGLAVPFGNLYVIGDSLSDQGNLFAATTMVTGPANALPASDHYFSGRFSNGPVYTDLLAARLGLPLGPSIAVGNNLAYGGARTAYNTVESTVGGPLPPGLFPWSLNAEVQAFRDRGISDPQGLYIVFSGSNDVADIITRGLDAASVIPDAVGGILGAVEAFMDAGAQTIVVPNVPDLGLTPLFLGLGPGASAAATQFSIAFNALLDTSLDAISGTDIVEVDTFGLFRNVIANPGAFGFSNVTTPCYSGFVAPNPAGIECANPDEFVFWDLVHPTARVHALLAGAVISAIPEPGTLPLVLLSLLLVAGWGRLASVKLRTA
jgi:phospholipase/lecithinase/hemolysin